MSGFPVCACEHTLPFGSPADQGSEQSLLQLQSLQETMLSSRPVHQGFPVATRCQNRTMCVPRGLCAQPLPASLKESGVIQSEGHLCDLLAVWNLEQLNQSALRFGEYFH